MSRFLSWVGFTILVSCSGAQSLRPGLDTLAIVGARIEVSPGHVIEKGTVVVKNGLIADVGETATVPPGADVVDGTGLFVYAGFVDCGITTGLRKAPDRPRQEELLDPSTDFATTMRWASPTIRPELSAADLFDPDDPSWKPERVAGFTTALVYPSFGVIKGQVAMVDTDGRARRSSLIAAPLGLAMEFSGGGDPYPGTPLGAYATARQAFLDAEWLKRASQTRKKAGAPRPPDDPGLTALADMQKLPAVFLADPIWKIDSVIAFAREIGVRPIVLGAKESYKRKGSLSGGSAILKLDFSAEPKPVTEAKDEAKVDETDIEPIAKKAERERVWLEGVRNAKFVADEGVLFAFTTEGCKDEATFFENLRRAVKEGLSREGALAALTANPARMFGLDKDLGTVEVGKIANLTVMTADFLDSKSKVKLLVVDGIKIDPSKEPFKPDNTPQSFGKEGGL